MSQTPATLKSIDTKEIDHTFTFNPNTIKWSYTENTATFDTLGGRVTQLLSVKADTMTVQGDTGSKKELQRLASNIASIMQYHLQTERPVRLTIPSRNWRFNVYVSQFPSIGFDVETISFPFQLKMEINEDFGVTTKKVLKNELDRLKKRIGYSPKWHGGNVELFTEIWGDLFDDDSSTGGGGSGPASFVGGNNTEIAFNYFVERGLTAEQSAGIVGNLIMESGVNPESVQAGGPGRGIAQWSVDERWATYLSWVKGRGDKPLTLEPQLDFIWYELKGSEGRAMGLLMNAPHSVAAAARAFASGYERPASTNYEPRVAAAKDVYERYA